MKVIGTKILVKKENVEDTVLSEKLGGFQIPVDDTSDGNYRVVSVGEEVTKELKVDDIVRCYPQPGHVVMEGGVEYRVITISDILTVL